MKTICRFCKEEFDFDAELVTYGKAFSDACFKCVRPFDVPAEDEAVAKRCRGCGYCVTDQEIAAFNQTFRNSKHEIIQQYNWCVFCAPYSLHEYNATNERPRLLNQLWWIVSIEGRIQRLKMKLRNHFLYSARFVLLNEEVETLLKFHYADVFPDKYVSDPEPPYAPVLNEHQKKYEQLIEELRELKDRPRMIYYDALQTFGDGSDATPAARNIPKHRKTAFYKALKAEFKKHTQEEHHVEKYRGLSP